MLGIVKEISGQKTIIPLTTDAGAGAPIGTLIQQYKKVPMSGYLYCDGSTFDQNAYPALYMYLGTNVLPDYRECVMVGAEQNTTDTIAAHDVYGEGEFKDDQLQNHEHDSARASQAGSGGPNISVLHTVPLGTTMSGSGEVADGRGRTGDTTHGKQKAVYVYIKATSGLAENQQDNVLNDVKDYVDNSNSYSAQEVKTGGTWIDGKPIYRIILTNTENIVSDQKQWGGLQSTITSLSIDNCIECKGVTTNGFRHMQFLYNEGFIAYYSGIEVGGKIILEYTKTN